MKRTSHKTKSVGKVEDIQKEIQEFLKRNPVATFKKRQLAKILGYTSEHEYARFKQALRALESKGSVQQTGRRKLSSGEKVTVPPGKLVLDRSGNVLFIPDEPSLSADIKVQFAVTPGGMSDANPGDKVKVKIVGGSGKLLIVRVTEVLEHEETRIVGTVQKAGSHYMLVTRDRNFPSEIDIPRKKLNGAGQGNKVVARLILDRHVGYTAEVTKVLGAAGDPEVELNSIAAQFNLRKDFPPDVSEEAERIPDTISREEISRRLDLRNEIIVTIDPEDARDFDDAVSLRTLPDDSLELGVHIADVSHYVTAGSRLDREALNRGTSVYLTNGVIPMLPHRLSNDICSLNPDVDRLTYSVIMTVTTAGKVIGYKIAKSVIKSKRRFTYEEVQKIIETGVGDHSETILAMNELAHTLTKLRSKAGSIDFDLPEAKFVFDELGRPVEILKKERLDSHRLVEEFMLLANKTVAAHIASQGVRAKPFIYRVHDLPDPERIKELAVFVSHFGYKLDYDGTVNQKQLQKLLHAVEGKPEEYLINDIMLRSMAKAVYSEKNIGHYGLAFKYYTHFTSPIRRYPDLIVHRLLHAYLTGENLPELKTLRKLVADVSESSSDAERRAVEAERESVKIKQTQYMMDHIGDEYEGTVSGVTSFGMFVEVDNVLVEGLVHVREMDDYFTFVPGQFKLKGSRSGKVYQLGDRVRVRVARVNMERHEIDFALC